VGPPDAASDLDFDLLAASLRADVRDVETFLETLAVKLEEAVPGRVRVDRRRAGLFGGKHVQAVEVDVGERRLELRHDAGGLDASASRVSGGIVLKREPLGVDEWLAALAEALAAEARRSGATRRALERLLMQ